MVKRMRDMARAMPRLLAGTSTPALLHGLRNKRVDRIQGDERLSGQRLDPLELALVDELVDRGATAFQDSAGLGNGLQHCAFLPWILAHPQIPSRPCTNKAIRPEIAESLLQNVDKSFRLVRA